MMDVVKMIIDANMQAIYMLGPEGIFMERARELEKKLFEYASLHPDAVDIVGEAGLRDEYTQLYMDVMTGGTGNISAENVMERIEDLQQVYDDSAVQTRIRAELSTILDALVFAWKDAREKIRQGDIKMEKYAQAMVVTRKQTGRFYRFLCEDMIIGLDDLDSVWFTDRDFVKSVLLSEILSDKAIEDILML